MVSSKTLDGVRNVLTEHIPGKAQRTRLLEALARVPGNRSFTDSIAALCTVLPSTPAGPVEAPKAGGTALMKAALIRYTQASAEVDVRMTRRDAEELVRDLDALDAFIAIPLVLGPGTVIGRLREAIKGVLVR